MHTCFHLSGRHQETTSIAIQYGPYKVLKREAKHFVVDINSRHDTVSLDRLKPVHSEQPVPTPDSGNPDPDLDSDLTRDTQPPSPNPQANAPPPS